MSNNITRVLSAIVITCDRSPGENYIQSTLQGIFDRGPIDSTSLANLIVLETDNPVQPMFVAPGHENVFFYCSERVLEPHEACAVALNMASHYGKWVLFIEDDVEISDLFFDSVAVWLRKHEVNEPAIYSFGNPCEYGDLHFTDLRPEHFYGTQCFAVRNDLARQIAKYLLTENELPSPVYDLAIGRFLTKLSPRSIVRHAFPSFVQHIGKDSKINPRENVHTFPSYPGQDWSYLKGFPK